MVSKVLTTRARVFYTGPMLSTGAYQVLWNGRGSLPQAGDWPATHGHALTDHALGYGEKLTRIGRRYLSRSPQDRARFAQSDVAST